MIMDPNLIGQMMLEGGEITSEQLDDALLEQKKTKEKIGTILVKMGAISEAVLIKYLGKKYGVPSILMDETEFDEGLINMIDPKIVQTRKVFPIKKKQRTLFLAMANPFDIETIEEVQFALGLDVKPLVTSEGSIKRAIAKYYKVDSRIDEVLADLEKTTGEGIEVVESEEAPDVSQLLAESGAAPIVKLVNTIVVDAVNRRASDIHIEPFEKEIRVRYRIDGALVEVMKPPKSMSSGIVSRIKIMSKLDLTERRMPQDGHISLKVSGRGVDLRVSTMPVIHGEKVVIRIAEQEGIQLDMRKLGFDSKSLEIFINSVEKPNGIVLVTGPTGSGKTVTLYSALARLNKIDVNIVTAEDPVERNLHGINQVNVNEEIGYTFAEALKAFLRQDPNIVMVGEVRDKETAEIAIKASLTGHLVLSTLHTNSCSATIMRLVDMGVAPYLIATSLVCIEAQRLVRKLCTSCRQTMEVDKELFAKMGIDPRWAEGVTLYKPKGCLKCNSTGYRGRVGIFEVMKITSNIKTAILDGANSDQITKIAMQEGMTTLRQDALMKMRSGVTSFEEVVKATVE